MLSPNQTITIKPKPSILKPTQKGFSWKCFCGHTFYYLFQTRNIAKIDCWRSKTLIFSKISQLSGKNFNYSRTPL